LESEHIQGIVNGKGKVNGQSHSSWNAFAKRANCFT